LNGRPTTLLLNIVEWRNIFFVLQAAPRTARVSGRKRGKSILATSTPEIKRKRTEAEEKAAKKDKIAKKKLFDLAPNPSDQQQDKQVMQVRKNDSKKKTTRSKRHEKSLPKRSTVKAPPKRRKPTPAKPIKTTSTTMIKPRIKSCQPELPRKPIWLENLNKSGGIFVLL
jgi:hypothetical protein